MQNNNERNINSKYNNYMYTEQEHSICSDSD